MFHWNNSIPVFSTERRSRPSSLKKEYIYIYIYIYIYDIVEKRKREREEREGKRREHNWLHQ